MNWYFSFYNKSESLHVSIGMHFPRKNNAAFNIETYASKTFIYAKHAWFCGLLGSQIVVLSPVKDKQITD